jgi:hypothetical protein
MRMLGPASFKNGSILALPNSFGEIFVAEHFVCGSESTGERIICSKSLLRYIDGWSSSTGFRLKSEELAILKNLGNLTSYSSLMSEYADSSSSQHLDLPIIVASSQNLDRYPWSCSEQPALLKTIRRWTSAHKIFWGGDSISQTGLDKHASFISALRSIFLQWLSPPAWWCPYVLAKLLSPSIHAYYLTFLTRKESPDFNHRNCSRAACTRNAINTSTYKSKRAVDGCSCQPVTAPLDDMISIIDSGGMVLVGYKPTPETNQAKERLNLSSLILTWDILPYPTYGLMARMPGPNQRLATMPAGSTLCTSQELSISSITQGSFLVVH